jgi:hypothetical protein
MTTSLMSYVFSPLSGLWSSLERTTMIVGYSRAASELARLGYQEEAKYCMMELKNLR